ncbi:MAG TPA: hypothetical protein PLF11_00020 [Bacillota bacterium]|nr:hypothetical protein [Dermatophilaceae bacterium]HOI35744.1 hypothetical protein [Bacillota bacterium]
MIQVVVQLIGADEARWKAFRGALERVHGSAEWSVDVNGDVVGVTVQVGSGRKYLHTATSWVSAVELMTATLLSLEAGSPGEKIVQLEAELAEQQRQLACCARCLKWPGRDIDGGQGCRVDGVWRFPWAGRDCELFELEREEGAGEGSRPRTRS